MSGGSFDHNLGGIVDGQGVEWDGTAGELIPTDLVKELEDLLDVTGTAAPTKGGLLVGDGVTWQVLLPGDDGQMLSPNSTKSFGLEYVDAATGGGDTGSTAELLVSDESTPGLLLADDGNSWLYEDVP